MLTSANTRHLLVLLAVLRARDADIFSKLKPFAKELTFSTVIGYCAGCATKSVGQTLAVAGGLVFIGLQVLNSNGVININWNKVEDKVTEKLDANNDGKLDIEDAKIYWKKFLQILTTAVPSSGAFAAGFYLALR